MDQATRPSESNRSSREAQTTIGRRVEKTSRAVPRFRRDRSPAPSFAVAQPISSDGRSRLATIVDRRLRPSRIWRHRMLPFSNLSSFNPLISQPAERLQSTHTTDLPNSIASPTCSILFGFPSLRLTAQRSPLRSCSLPAELVFSATHHEILRTQSTAGDAHGPLSQWRWMDGCVFAFFLWRELFVAIMQGSVLVANQDDSPVRRVAPTGPSRMKSTANAGHSGLVRYDDITYILWEQHAAHASSRTRVQRIGHDCGCG